MCARTPPDREPCMASLLPLVRSTWAVSAHLLCAASFCCWTAPWSHVPFALCGAGAAEAGAYLAAAGEMEEVDLPPHLACALTVTSYRLGFGFLKEAPMHPCCETRDGLDVGLAWGAHALLMAFMARGQGCMTCSAYQATATKQHVDAINNATHNRSVKTCVELFTTMTSSCLGSVVHVGISSCAASQVSELQTLVPRESVMCVGISGLRTAGSAHFLLNPSQ